MSLGCALRGRLRTVLVCTMLETGVMLGVPIRPQQIEELLHTMNQPKIAHVLKEEHHAGDGSDDDGKEKRHGMRRTSRAKESTVRSAY
jgi:hypothetical protein